jgi:hypothetical protein
MADWDVFIDNLSEEPDSIQTRTKAEVRFPCGECAGTGRYSGPRVHQEKSHCFACRGRGYFKTDPRKLKQQRERRAAKAAQNAIDNQAANAESGLLQAFAEFDMTSWNSFAADLLAQHHAGKAWSEKQIVAALNMVEKVRIKRQQRLAEAISVDLSSIAAMFETARASGYKRPVYRAEGLVISPAPESGVNAGALYVKDTNRTYLGKIVNSKYLGRDEAKEALLTIAQDPKQAAIRYGQRTGSCACCGRSLSNAASIELGIGPICAQKWFGN